MGRERVRLPLYAKDHVPEATAARELGLGQDGRRREPVGVEGAKVKVPGRTGDEHGLKDSGASRLEGRGGRAGRAGRGQAPPNLLSAVSQPFPEAASS